MSRLYLMAYVMSGLPKAHSQWQVEGLNKGWERTSTFRLSGQGFVVKKYSLWSLRDSLLLPRGYLYCVVQVEDLVGWARKP